MKRVEELQQDLRDISANSSYAQMEENESLPED